MSQIYKLGTKFTDTDGTTWTLSKYASNGTASAYLGVSATGQREFREPFWMEDDARIVSIIPPTPPDMEYVAGDMFGTANMHFTIEEANKEKDRYLLYCKYSGSEEKKYVPKKFIDAMASRVDFYVDKPKPQAAPKQELSTSKAPYIIAGIAILAVAIWAFKK